MISPVASALRQLADFADVRGDSAEAAEWRRLANDLERGPEAARAAELARSNRLSELTDLFPRFRRTLQRLWLTDPDGTVLAHQATLPWLLRRVIELGAIDSVGAAALSRLGIVTLLELEAALDDNRIAARLPDNVEALRMAADALAFDRPRITLGRAMEVVEGFVQLVTAACPQATAVVPAGDLRRFEPLVESVTVVVSAPDPVAVIERVKSLPAIHGALHATTRRALLSYQQTEIDLRVAPPDEFGTALFTATGAPAHLAAMRARQRSARLCAREEDVYSQVGLPWIAPELRHGTGEIEAAAEGRLPALVVREDIRGDLHMHSTYSDGRDSLAEMVQKAAALGYEYIAITDHSERAGASRTVSRDMLARQRDEIARLRSKHAGMAILHGVEVDIMRDGRLDFPDEILEGLDIVLASLHDPAGGSPERLTRRCLAAIEHPLVNVITHPANRLVGRDGGYALDFPAIYEAAARTGTALEIDGAPGHLDLDGEHARAAVAAGVTVTIDSDCHRARLLDRQMRMGIGTARRGWVEPRHVLNARPLAAVQAFIASKRSGGL